MDFYKDYNHLGTGNPQTKEEKDFNKFLHETNFYMSKEATPFPIRDQMPAKIINSAEGFADKMANEGSPFFMWVSIPEPHNPYQAPEPYYSMFPPESLPPVIAGPETITKKAICMSLKRKSLKRIW